MLDDSGLDLLFQKARTPRRWMARPVEPALLRRLYSLVSLGPTSGNCSPARFVFITASEGRERLRPALSAGNVNRVMGAPVIAIVAYDPLFLMNCRVWRPMKNSVRGLRRMSGWRKKLLSGTARWKGPT